MRELMEFVHYTHALAPQDIADDNAKVGSIIDLQGFEDCTFVIVTGTLGDAGATFAVLIEHGDDSGLSDAAAAPDTDLVGTEAGASFDQADDNATRKVAYVGPKRYVRLTVTATGVSGSANLVGAIAALRPSNRQPAADGGQAGI